MPLIRYLLDLLEKLAVWSGEPARRCRTRRRRLLRSLANKTDESTEIGLMAAWCCALSAQLRTFRYTLLGPAAHSTVATAS